MLMTKCLRLPKKKEEGRKRWRYISHNAHTYTQFITILLRLDFVDFRFAFRKKFTFWLMMCHFSFMRKFFLFKVKQHFHRLTLHAKVVSFYFHILMAFVWMCICGTCLRVTTGKLSYFFFSDNGDERKWLKFKLLLLYSQFTHSRTFT